MVAPPLRRDAGPWAEARSQWTRDSLDSLDDEDDDGRPFRYYVREAFDVNRDGDLDKYEQLEEGILPDGTRSSRRPPERLNSRCAQEMRSSRNAGKGGRASLKNTAGRSSAPSRECS
ncbi:MAG TPA: hypothetical protein VEF72_20820 [Mycobacterium sp.]|nr:hypothetical protein [Mycobacterium sp.]